MRPLDRHTPSAEQLPLVRDERPGDVLIRGAAGSGKTTTALLRLKFLSVYWLNRRQREGITDPVRVLALTYNRTLEGYIRELARSEVIQDPALDLTVLTVSAWARSVIGFNGAIWEGTERDDYIWRLGCALGFGRQFLLDEVNYVLGRFPPGQFHTYLDAKVERTGRGRTPRVSAAARKRLLDEVLVPLNQHKHQAGLVDWNDLAVLAAATPPARAAVHSPYHVVVVDEAQDFSVNQMRAVRTHLASEHSLTVVIDTAQRIYPQYLDFAEANIGPFRRTHSLTTNYRNTPAIASFAQGLLTGLTLDENASPPSPTATASSKALPSGARTPQLIVGRFSEQLRYTVQDLTTRIGPLGQTAAILTPWTKGVEFVGQTLDAAGLDWLHLQRAKYWGTGQSNIAVSTLHSAKGLEFDHVFILGLNGRTQMHGSEPDDATLDRQRRLLAMAVGRARCSVTIGYLAQERSDLLDYLTPGTYNESTL